VGEAVDVAWAEDEAAAELERIAAQFVLMVAGIAGALAALEIVAAEKVKKVGLAEVGDFVGLAAFINQQREVDSGFFLKKSGVVGITEADSGQGCAFFAEGLLMPAQLRDVLAAKDSSVVAEKNNHGGGALP
jgi:hypothetical protein